VHAENKQGATAVWMAGWPVPHWQPWSVRAQPAAMMADVRQGIAQAGSAPNTCAAARLAAAAIIIIEAFILTSFLFFFFQVLFRFLYRLSD